MEIIERFTSVQVARKVIELLKECIVSHENIVQTHF